MAPNGEHDAAGQEQDVPKVLDRYAIFRAIAHVALLPVLRATIPPSPLTVMDPLLPPVAPIAVFALVNMATSPPVTLLLPVPSALKLVDELADPRISHSPARMDDQPVVEHRGITCGDGQATVDVGVSLEIVEPERIGG
ncbi:MAG TPA: hypothetical protein EYO90_12890, partial [Candidatus Latescibacteria bacterium]|nr:hypothetical protein [Candidatus Latescibacterota bacterium]